MKDGQHPQSSEFVRVDKHNFARIWPLVEGVVKTGDTYALNPDLSF